jgi:AcrR family transcriptional regulator
MADRASRRGGTPGRARNRRGEGARLRQELLAAAEQLLEHAGSERELGIRAVTRQAGVAPQSFYLHFDSVSELLFAVYQEQYERLRQAMQQAADRQDAPDGRLWAVAHAYCDFAQHRPGSYRVLTAVRGQLHPEWAGRQLPGMPAFNLLRQAVADALTARGRGDDPFEVAVCLWAAMHGLVSLRLDRPAFPWPPTDELVDELVGRILTGAGRRPAG